MRRIRDEFLTKLEAVLPLKNKIILELGSGDGRLSAQLAGKCQRLVGIEPDRDRIEVARGRNIPNAKFHRRRAEDLPFAYAHFHVAIFALSLHHIPADRMDLAIDEAVKVTGSTGEKSAGHVVFLEPGTKGSFFEAEIRFDACDGDERKAKENAAQAVMRHKRLTLESEFTDYTAFRFSSVADFKASMTPKKNLEGLAGFLRRHNFVLKAERHTKIFRVRGIGADWV